MTRVTSRECRSPPCASLKQAILFGLNFSPGRQPTPFAGTWVGRRVRAGLKPTPPRSFVRCWNQVPAKIDVLVGFQVDGDTVLSSVQAQEE